MDLACAEPWDDYRAPESPYRATSHPSPNNRVRPKDAGPKVISSILTSLDTLTPLPNVPLTNDHYSDSASKRSRARSSSRSIASSVSYSRTVSSPGFGVEYGTGVQLDDEDGLSDAALPPTIPTSRPPSGLSNYKIAHPSPASTKRPTTAVFRPRTGSRRSSLSTASDVGGNKKNKLSSESWVRMNAEVDDRSINSRGRTPRKSLRRVESQDMLRPAATAPSSAPALSEYFPPVSLAEQIIARNPPPLSTSKGRLYLTDATVSEDQHLADSPIFPSPVLPGQMTIPETESKPASDNNLAVAEGITPPALTPSPISDSIPTRTSSLRQASSSPAPGKRKSKKSRKERSTSARPKKMGFKQSPSIPDSKWADLGEDDETVKRIIQLREQRKSRLQELTLDPNSDFLQADPKSLLVHGPSEEGNQALRGRPAVNRATTEPPQSQTTFRGGDVPLPDLEGSRVTGARGTTESPSVGRQSKFYMEVRRPSSAHNRPTTSKSEHSAIQPHSLDYSYAQAMDALNGANLYGLDEEQMSPEASQRGSLQDLQPPRTRVTHAPVQHKLSKKYKKTFVERWVPNQSDATMDSEKKKNRRKSMSDARLARATQQEEELARMDGIEEAVNDYLKAPRLSRTVPNPSTGRTVAFSEVGDPEGAAVFVCVGMGLTRYVTAFYDELATTLRLRLITLDRPGVGGSEALPSSDKSGPLSWPEDVLAVCQHLDIVRFSIIAHSAGAIYALATALILPHLVNGKVHLLAPWVPPSQLEAISHPAASAPPANPLPRSQRFLRVLPTPFLKAANTSFMTATSASLKPAKTRSTRAGAVRTPPRKHADAEESPARPMSTDRPDYARRESLMLMDRYMPTTHPLDNFPPKPLREEDGGEMAALKRNSLVMSATATPTDPSFAYASIALNAAEHAEKARQLDYSSLLTQRTWELATRDSNPATDLLVCLERTRDVGFRYTDVGREVVITHGSEDKRVPIANVKWLAEQMNRRALGLSLGEDARASKESYMDAFGRGGCEVRVLQGEGHGLMASPSIMGDILTEIAGYWVGTDRGRL